MVKVYADGSITPSLMTSPHSSETSTHQFFGRICVIIPDLDYGLIERFVEGLLTAKGNPDTTYSEFLAITRALEICKERSLDDYVIYSDAKGAVDQVAAPEVKWLPAGEFNPASAFLSRVLSRASYLRRSSRKITRRMPLTPAQDEVFRLLQADKEGIKLSSSPLWSKLQSDLGLAS